MKKSKQEITFVPWFNIGEWLGVYELLYGENANQETKKKAFNTLSMWKSRIPSLQAGVEGTLIILSGLLQKNQTSYNSRLIKSTTLMRFLNICAAYDKKQGTFYNKAKKNEIPEWIISLRHDVAHSQNLPSEEVLDKALTFCNEWLYDKYWQPVSLQMKDYNPQSAMKFTEYNQLKLHLEPYMTNYVYINLATHPYWNYNKIGDIVDEEVKKSIINDLQVLTSKEKINNDTELKEVLHMLWCKIRTILYLHDTKKKKFILPELLVESKIFFCEIEEYDSIFKVTDPGQIPESFLFLWEGLLKNMHNNNMLTELIETLLNIVNNETLSSFRRKMAALWLNELGNAFNKCIVAQNLYQIIPSEKTAKFTEKKIKIKLEESKPEYRKILTLKLLNDIPHILTNAIIFKEKILKHPNEYMLIFLPIFLNLNDTFKSETTTNLILRLTKLYINTENEQQSSCNIYQITDIKKIIGNNHSKLLKNRVVTNDKITDYNIELHSQQLWRFLTDVDLEGCPIGVLPWQLTTKNPFLDI